MRYRKLSSDLLLLGYKSNKLAMRVLHRLEKDHTQTTLLLHVDDMKIISSSEIIIDQVINEIEAIHPNLTEQINYLGMTFDYSIPGKTEITMANYIRNVLEGCADITGTADSSAHIITFLLFVQL